MWVFSFDRLTQQIASVSLFVFIERIIKWLYGEKQSEHKICSVWLEFTIQKPECLDWRRVQVRNQICALIGWTHTSALYYCEMLVISVEAGWKKQGSFSWRLNLTTRYLVSDEIFFQVFGLASINIKEN